MMDVAEMIPVGRDNAIPRAQLISLLGTDDRNTRNAVSQLKKTEVVISCADGSGYFKPSVEDIAEVKDYYRREHNRAMDILKGLKLVGAWIDDVEHERIAE